jgi:hypothetical protein
MMMPNARLTLHPGDVHEGGIVIGFEKTQGGSNYYRVACKHCGREYVTKGSSLASGKAKSCGCLSKIGKTTHGLASVDVLTYTSWNQMRARCFTSSNINYHRYGARGIRPCAFLAADPRNLLSVIGPRPDKSASLDRPEHEGGYWCGQCEECRAAAHPKNVRWLDRKGQARNTGRNRVIEAFGERRLLCEWAELSGLGHKTILYRLEEAGMFPEEALTKPDKRGHCLMRRVT